MRKENVLITDKVHPLLTGGLAALGYTVTMQPLISLEEVRRIIGGYQGLIINSKIRVDEAMLAAAPGLLFIGRLGSGMEIIDLEAAARRGVAVFSAPEGNANAVAEHALGMLLSLSNHLSRCDRQVRAGLWDREGNRGWELAGRTLGIIGLGHTGSAFARKLRGLDVVVLGYDKYREDWDRDLPWVERVALADLQARADILSLHLPLTPETRGFVDRTFLEACRPGVVLINTARGNQVDSGALVEALEAGRAGGACLDVFDNERPDRFTPEERVLYSRLYALDQVVLSPHVAGWTRESLRGIGAVLLDKIRRWKATYGQEIDSVNLNN
jgi:D-3-phosphoglycerate dehydrogenase / 2-oxoglutarate reductase